MHFLEASQTIHSILEQLAHIVDAMLRRVQVDLTEDEVGRRLLNASLQGQSLEERSGEGVHLATLCPICPGTLRRSAMAVQPRGQFLERPRFVGGHLGDLVQEGQFQIWRFAC